MPKMDEFLEKLKKDPKLLERLKKREELNNFKESYNLGGATPLKCPVCSAYLKSPGSLWADKVSTSRFVCRKCKLEFTLECHTIPNSQLVGELRRVLRGEGSLPEWALHPIKEESNSGEKE